ncbi:MAG: fumarate hydratase [Chitinispirillaceae bacterium]
MKTIQFQDIVSHVSDLCIKASVNLPEDVYGCIADAADKERMPRARTILRQYLENARIAQQKDVAICQDTGFAVFLVEIGSEVYIRGGTLNDAISQGVELGYARGFLRKSIVDDPVFDRINTGTNTPPIIHVEIVTGDSLHISLAPKGGGSENMSSLAMLKPSDGKEGIIRFVVDSVAHAGANPCPPTIVGVGIGGTFEKAAFLAKKALFRPIGSQHPDSRYAEMEQEILKRVNQSGVGAQGLGGYVTAFAVHIEKYPCHIATLPVAVNLNCHAARHAHITL